MPQNKAKKYTEKNFKKLLEKTLHFLNYFAYWMRNKKWDWIGRQLCGGVRLHKEQKAVNTMRWLLCNYWLRNHYIEITMWRWCVVQRSSVRKDACGNASRQIEYRGVTPTKGALRDTKQWVCSALDADKVKRGMNPAISWYRDGTENGTGIGYGSPNCSRPAIWSVMRTRHMPQ